MARENIIVSINTEVDSKQLEAFRKKLNEARNELNAEARALDKSSKEYKTLKLAVKDLNNTRKLSDDELRKHIALLNQEDQAMKKNTKSQSDSNKAFGEGSLAIAGYTASAIALTKVLYDLVKAGAESKVLKDNFAGTAQEMDLLRQATVGTVTDSDLIKLSNQASDLGISLKDQAKLFSLAEDAADKYGGSLEENFQRVVYATDGSAKGLKALGITATSFKKEVERLTDSMNVNIDSLDADEQQAVKIEAIFNLTGTTLESVTKKTKDNKDQIDALEVSSKNAADTFGISLSEGIASTIKPFQKMADNTGVLSTKMPILETVANAAGIVLTKMNAISIFSYAIDQANELIDLIRQIGQSARNAQQSAVHGVGDALGKLGKLDGTSGTATDRKKTSNSSSNSKAKDKEDLDKIAEIQKKLGELEADKVKYLAQYSETSGVVLDTMKEILKLQNELNYLQNGSKIFDTSGIVLQSRKLSSFTSEDIRQAEYQAKSDRMLEDANKKDELSKSLIDDTETVYSGITNILSALNIGTETFVGKILSGFDSAATIIKSLQTINSVFSLIPGFASGGEALAGMPYMAGERGTELIFPQTNHTVLNHSDTMRYLNSNSGGQVNVYLSSNVNQRYLDVGIEKHNSTKNYIKVSKR